MFNLKVRIMFLLLAGWMCGAQPLSAQSISPFPASPAKGELALDFQITHEAAKWYGNNPNYPDTFVRGINVTKDWYLIGLGTGSEVIAISKDMKKYRVMANDIVAYGLFFGMGVASDNKSVWTTDYFGGNVFQFEIETGKLIKTWKGPLNLHRLDYDPMTNNLAITAYNDPNIYIYSRDGVLIKTIPVQPCGSNITVSVLTGGYLVMGAIIAGDSDKQLYLYDRSGRLAQKLNFELGYSAIDYYDGHIYFDTPEGTIRRIRSTSVSYWIK